MSTSAEEVTRCDRCGESADGDQVDCVYCLQCGHDVCTNCEGHLRRHHPEVRHPMEWCPVCNGPVKGPYAQ